MSTTGCKGGFNSIHHTVNDEHKKMNSQEFSSGPNVFVPQKIAEMLIKKREKTQQAIVTQKEPQEFRHLSKMLTVRLG